MRRAARTKAAGGFPDNSWLPPSDGRSGLPPSKRDTRAKLRSDWLQYAGFGYSDRDRAARDFVARLFDLQYPNPEQEKILFHVRLHMVALDFPVADWAGNKRELLRLVEAAPRISALRYCLNSLNHLRVKAVRRALSQA